MRINCTITRNVYLGYYFGKRHIFSRRFQLWLWTNSVEWPLNIATESVLNMGKFQFQNECQKCQRQCFVYVSSPTVQSLCDSLGLSVVSEVYPSGLVSSLQPIRSRVWGMEKTLCGLYCQFRYSNSTGSSRCLWYLEWEFDSTRGATG